MSTADGHSGLGNSFSADGNRWVDLIGWESGSEDDNRAGDVLVRDRNSRSATFVSLREDGSGTATGRRTTCDLVRWKPRRIRQWGHQSGLRDTNDRPDLFVRDLVASKTLLVSSRPGWRGHGVRHECRCPEVSLIRRAPCRFSRIQFRDLDRGDLRTLGTGSSATSPVLEASGSVGFYPQWVVMSL